MDSLDEAHARLKLAVKSGSVREIDEAVSNVMLHRDPESIKHLLFALSDETEYDEGMFSILHAAESFDDRTYTDELIPILPRLREAAPRWASIAFIRLVNNSNTRQLLLSSIPNNSSAVRESIAWLCNKISERKASFLEKTTPILTAISTSERLGRPRNY